MQTIRCLLIDDEPPAIELLQKYAGMVDQLEVVGTSHSAVHAFNSLKDLNVDLMFLDIRMPVLNGLDFIKTLKHPPATIFTTAYREYALEGYDLDVIDYLLKPIAFDRFLKAVNRYQERVVTNKSAATPIAPQPEYIFCNVNKTRHKVALDDIIYIESLKDYVRIHMPDNNLVVKSNLGSFMKQLPAGRFVRIHRSFAVALSSVRAHNQSTVSVGGKCLPIGISYREALLEQLK